MEKLTAFERGQIVGAFLGFGASVAKTAELLNVSKETVSEVMAAYSKHGQAELIQRKRLKTEKASKNSTSGNINSPIHALEKALALENQGDEDEEDDEDVDDEHGNINRPIHALEKALALEKQGDDEEEDDEDIEDKDMNVQKVQEDEDYSSGEDQNESQQAPGEEEEFQTPR